MPCAPACRVLPACAAPVGTPLSGPRSRRGPSPSGSVGAPFPCMSWRAGGSGGGGGACSALGVGVWWESTSGCWPVPPSLVRDPGLGAPGARPSPCHLPTGLPVTCVAASVEAGAVWCRKEGGRQGALACRTSRPAPSVLGCRGALVFVGAGGGGPGQWSAGQQGTPLPWAPLCRALPACADPVVPPPACLGPLWRTTARIRGPGPGGAPPPVISWRTDGWGCVCRGSRGHDLPRGAPWAVGPRLRSRLLATPPPTLRCLPSGVWGSAHRAPGQTLGGSSPAPPAPGAMGRESRRHLTLRFCGGSGCSGGGFLGP